MPGTYTPRRGLPETFGGSNDAFRWRRQPFCTLHLRYTYVVSGQTEIRVQDGNYLIISHNLRSVEIVQNTKHPTN